MPYTPSSALSRRIGFWDSLTYYLNTVIKDTGVETAMGWLDEDGKDASAMSNVLAMLRAAQIVACGRYQEVLGEKISELQDIQNQEASDD